MCERPLFFAGWSRQRRGRAAVGASLLALAARGCPALLGVAAASQNSLRGLRPLRSNSCDESVVDARCARGRNPCAVGSGSHVLRTYDPAPQLRCRLRRGAPPATRPRLCRHARGVLRPACQQWWLSRQGVPGRRDLWGDEKRRGEGGARSALRQLTRRNCPSEAGAARAASFATRPRTEHRSGVGAQRRPPQRERLPGTHCRDALNLQREPPCQC